MPRPTSAGPLQVTWTEPAGATVCAATLVTAKGVMRVEPLQPPTPVALTARTWYEQVACPAGHVVCHVPSMLRGTTGALVQAALSSLQFPRHVRPWYAVIGSPPVFPGAPQLTVTVGV